MDIDLAIAHVQDLWTEIHGIRSAPSAPPESINEDPIAITYEKSGTAAMDKGWSWGAQTGIIWSELHVSRQDLAQTIKRLAAFRNLFLRKIWNDPNLGGTVMIVRTVSWEMGPDTWGEENPVSTMRYRFVLEVELELSPT
jgi:hypothetical protein